MFNKLEVKKTLEVKNDYYLNRSEIQNEKTQPQGLNIPDVALYFSPVGLFFSGIIFVIVWRKIRIYLDNKMVFGAKGLHQVPCRNCRFYSNNHYLKCAVQPSIVMTNEAKNCSEFSPKKDKLSEKRF